MGKRWSKFAIAMVALAAGVQAAPAAAAEPAILAGEDLPEHVHALRLAGSNGYRIEIIAVSEGLGSGSQVYVGVGSRTGLASYNAPALVTADAIQADLGRFGRIDLTLYPSGREKTISVRCSKGQSYPFEPGVFEGVLAFRGEKGFTRAHATRLPLRPPVTSFCGGGVGRGETSGSGLRGARIRGGSFGHGRILSFQLNKNHARGRVLFEASLRERRDGVSIYRAVGGWLPSSSFRYDPQLRTAQLSPPTPFSGSASLRRTPNSVSPQWNGDLTLDFPGRTVPLAGPGVHVNLRHACFTLSNQPSVKSC